MKTISSLLPLAAALGTLGLVCGCSKQADADTPQPTLADNRLPVRTQPAATGAFVRSVRVQGTLESVNSAIVSARIDGPLLTVDVDLGDAVQAGVTRLFSVDPVEVSNNVVVAREVLATAKAQVTVAEAQLQRAEAVAEVGNIFRTFGLRVGISAGAAVLAARAVAEKEGGKVLAILPDRGDRYPDELYK